MDAETTFDIGFHGSIPVIRIKGDLDHHIAPRLRLHISDAIEQGHKDLILDFTNVSFMDSGGMSEIVYALKRATAADGRVMLAGCSARITRRLNIGGLTRLDGLKITSSVEQALQELGAA